MLVGAACFHEFEVNDFRVRVSNPECVSISPWERPPTPESGSRIPDRAAGADRGGRGGRRCLLLLRVVVEASAGAPVRGWRRGEGGGKGGGAARCRSIDEVSLANPVEKVQGVAPRISASNERLVEYGSYGWDTVSSQSSKLRMSK